MKLDCRLCLLLLVAAAVLVGARKGRRKDRKSPPNWKSSSMPKMNKRFESVHEGEELKFDCKAQGHPRPSITWYKDGVKLMDGDKIQVRKFVLALTDLTTDMSGNYSCLVENKHGNLNWTFHLDVQGERTESTTVTSTTTSRPTTTVTTQVKVWPLVVEGPSNMTQMVGSNVAFRCKVLNDPQATIRWQKIGSEIREPNSPPRDFLDNGDDPEILMLDNIKKEDEGEYRCMAGNVWGLKYTSAWLTVIEPATRAPSIFDVDTNRMTDSPRGYDPYNPYNPYNPNNNGDMDEEDDFDYGGGNLDPYDFGPDLYYTTTTRRPKNRNNRRKNGRKKDRKKDNNRKAETTTSIISTTTTTTTTTTSMATPAERDNMFKTTFPEIWKYDNNERGFNDFSDTRYNPPTSKPMDEKAEAGKTGSAKSSDNKTIQGSISSWTIYTIVGAVGGVILLVGLVAITLTLCCKKEDGGVYKSTPV